ncbi:MAG: FHA domain-containing protein [Actinomycetota bacterium]|nr:FHA domain-containing protein [Actinomycetota bacterium]
MQDLRIEVDGRTVALRDETVVQIGRDVPDGIVVGGDSVSRVHAELRRTGSTWTLVDLGSRNGTFIDGQRIGEHRISAPVTVHLGLPDAGTSLLIRAVPTPRVDDAAHAELGGAYGETMVAADIDTIDLAGGDLDLDDESQQTGPDLVVRVGTARFQFSHSTAVSVGRRPDNDVVVAEQACSRIHGYVEPTPDGWVYRNVSEQGTFHREEPIETITLEDVPIVLKLGHPDAGPRLELAHLGMSALVSEPIDAHQVIEVGRHRISRRIVRAVAVVAIYFALAALAVTQCDARETSTNPPGQTTSINSNH